MNAPQVEVYADKRGQWRWRLRSRNGRILCQGESHTRKADAERAADTMLDTAVQVFLGGTPKLKGKG